MSARRIVCLTEETVETLYLLGEQDRIVGVTGYAVRPPQVRREKPRVGAFTSANVDKILALDPDLVLTFSDLQADIAASLIRKGIAVHAFNQRNVEGILDMIETLGALCGAADRAAPLVERLRANLEAVRARAAQRSHRPRVFFEEWDDPLISAIRWVSELIEIAGGRDVFADLAHAKSAAERIVSFEDAAGREPDIIIGSWCGKKFQPSTVATRPGFQSVPAVRTGALHEIKSPLILQPGPAALTDGLSALESIIGSWPERPPRAA
jgi:iron complex transport system substrate-binding protein